jgi:hypothetical protein
MDQEKFRLSSIGYDFVTYLRQYGIGKLKNTEKYTFPNLLSEKVDRAYFLVKYTFENTFEKLEEDRTLTDDDMQFVKKIMLKQVIADMMRPTVVEENEKIMNNVIANFLYMNKNTRLEESELTQPQRLIYEKIKTHTNDYIQEQLERKIREYELAE